ncbi:MAG: MBL fold metallo-hydrolase [Betaproteobacteria bacterium RIFCSPLOWO2_12_FULL_62_13b]|nr:MAG: MBL fold metallo-hydrolase [Betaproteobacteria bacterium RIFCSPLOWO2_12_FULL_62_13b]
MALVIDYPHGISAVDSEYLRPRLDAIHLVIDNGRCAIVDTGANSSVPRVMEALAAKGIKPEAVDYVVLTHIHLDHAGGAGLLMARLPNATLTVHPRGARHMSDPSRLVQGTIAVYGEQSARGMYGDLVPVPRERILETPHGASILLGARELLFLDTPGHARHHVSVVDSGSGDIFSGDTFGLSYRELDCDGKQFVFPTTSPVQFDPEAEHRSLELLLSHKPGAIYVTHFSSVQEVERLASDMHRLVDAHAELALELRDAGAERGRLLQEGVARLVLGEAERYRWKLPARQILEVFSNDIELNALGLEAWLDAQS